MDLKATFLNGGNKTRETEKNQKEENDLEQDSSKHIHMQVLEDATKTNVTGILQNLKPRLAFNDNLKKGVIVFVIIFVAFFLFSSNDEKPKETSAIRQSQEEELQIAHDENNKRMLNEYVQTAKEDRETMPEFNGNLSDKKQSETPNADDANQTTQDNITYQKDIANSQQYYAEREQIRINQENIARERAIQKITEEKAVFISPATTNNGNWGNLKGTSQEERKTGASLDTTRSTANQLSISTQDDRINNFLNRLGGNSGGNEQQQAQKDRIDFFNSSDNGRGTLKSTRQAPVSPYLLPSGTYIPCTLVGGVNSDLPGDVVASVTEDVYDWKNPNIVLIPQGTRVFGSYNSKVAWAQHRIQVSWKRVIFPDGSTLELNGMSGVDKRGYSGLKDKQYAHYGKLLTASIMTAAFSSVGLLFDDKATVYVNGTTTNPRSEFAKEIGSSLGKMGEKLFSKNLNIPPTILIRPATRFNIMVNADIPFYIGYRKKLK